MKHPLFLQGKPVHICKAGCCGPEECHDRGVSIEKATELFRLVIFTHVRQPALSKWTSVDPAIRRLSLHVLFHGITRRAMQRALRLRETSDIEDFVAEAVAPAIQTPTVHRRLQTSRDQVATRLCSNRLQTAVGECFPGWRIALP